MMVEDMSEHISGMFGHAMTKQFQLIASVNISSTIIHAFTYNNALMKFTIKHDSCFFVLNILVAYLVIL